MRRQYNSLQEGKLCPYTKESSVATSEETPATITAARAKLEPVPPGDEAIIIVAKTRGIRPRALTTARSKHGGEHKSSVEGDHTRPTMHARNKPIWR